MAEKNRLKRRRPLYFKDWRKHRGLTQEQLADRMSLTQGHVAKVESGQTAYTQPYLEAMADALSCAPADLLRPPNPPESDLAAYLMSLGKKKRERALKVLRALEELDDSDDAEGSKVA